MIVAGIFIYLFCGCALTSASIYGSETYGGEEWWLQTKYLKFYSPSGKNYFLDFETGEISLERVEAMQEQGSAKGMTSPYISFVSVTLKIYDIFFEHQDLQYIPRIVEKQVKYEDKSIFIRHSLHSFVGPDQKIYTLTYGISNITIDAGPPDTDLDHSWIKTYGPFSKWEHTYIFSQNGDTAMDITLSPVKISTDRSIQLGQMEAGPLKERSALVANFNTPSGNRYLFSNELNIALDQDKKESTDEPYITFIEPNQKVFDIHFQQDGSQYVPRLMARDSNTDANAYDTRGQLRSFVGPDKKTYRIDHNNQSGEAIPILDSSPISSSDFRLTFIVTDKYYKKSINFIFSNEGSALYDRVDELDYTSLAEQSALSVNEVDVDGEFAKSAFLTFYSPSGRIYYMTPGESTAAAMGIHNNPDSPYITFALQDGRTSSIYYESSGATEMKFSSSDRTNSTSYFMLQSFVTPDKKFHKILTTIEDGIRVPYIDITAQPRDPFDDKVEDSLKIVLVTAARQYHYHFTWNGDKLVDVGSYPLKRVSSSVLKSLIG